MRQFTSSPSSVTELLNIRKRGCLSSRSVVLREANRRGLAVGIRSRADKPIGRKEARLQATESMTGKDAVSNCAVPARWRPLFERAFVKAALYGAHTKNMVRE
jgi:hypothetical protein